jgi:transketolase
MEIVSRPHGKNIVKWAKDKPGVVVLSADLTSSCEANDFRDTYPDRFFSMGMAEQNMMSFAGGMAREGYTPFVHTFAVFIYRRPYDQVAMSIAYPNLRVRLLGFLPGITTPGGVTHQAIEDIAVMRSLPNMTILECGDATDVESVLDVAHNVDGPVYLRMLRGEVPRLFPHSSPMQFGKPRTLRNGTDITVLSTGICTEEALRATAVLSAMGLSIQHLHITTLKPFNPEEILQAVSTSRYGVITMENHTIVGGIGSIIAEALAEAGLGKRLIRVGIKDTFAHGASRSYLMKKYGLDALALVKAIEDLSNQQFSLTEADLADVRIEAVHSDAKAEAL